jgi:hypothetical protein
VERSKPRIDTSTLASLIFRTPELDKAQIGNLLVGNDDLMRRFLERFYFLEIRLDEALRMFLLAVRLPASPDSSDYLLQGFAERYWTINRHTMGEDRDFTYALVKSIIQLNDAWYGIYGFSTPNHAITFDIWVGSLRGRDVGTGMLRGIYEGIKGERLGEAICAGDAREERRVEVIPKVPGRLTVGEWSEVVRVKIDQVDVGFGVRLLGEGMEFEPEILDFSTSTEVGFRFRGTGLGVKSIVFHRLGSNAYVFCQVICLS